jgi:23S rRNA (guanosine2251-2'-O)-methyltransferase
MDLIVIIVNSHSRRKKVNKYLKDSGLKVLAASEKGTNNYYQEDMNLPLALVMGAEDVGVSASILKSSDAFIGIPQVGKIGSLNVSVATGIILFEALRQRMA